VYTVSHNLRSPLKSLSGLLTLAMSEKNPATLAEFHQVMQQSISKLDEMVQGILDLSRSSRQEFRIEQISIRSIIEETFQKMAYLPEFRKISVEILVDGEADFYSDSYRISAILQNLISNSIKYKDPHKPFQFIKIVVSITDEAAVIHLSDNGIGIHTKALDHIFKMFYRATDQHEGTGLGLSIVKEAVDLLEGSVDVESTLGEGTKFHLRIPNRNNIKRESIISSLLIDRD
jgi:signal transduction histidine kinase